MQPIVSELSQCLDAWPSGRQFTVDDVLAEHPEFGDDSLAIEGLILEEYVRRLEAGERINPSAYCERFSSLSPALIRQLQNLADLNNRHELLNSDNDRIGEFPQPGDELNGYTLTKEIGRGAFSRVFLARDGHVAGRQVVVKTTFHGCAEIELLGPLSHPHLPRIFYCGRDPETNITTICMDWIGERSLNNLISDLHFPDERPAEPSCSGQSQEVSGGSSPSLQRKNLADRSPGPSARSVVATSIQVIRQVADGLAYAHQQGVLHLDVKPSNILLRDDGTAVLIDFNLAITASQSQGVGFRGTLAYAAPEVIATAVQGEDVSKTVTEAADVYSLGTVFYELLTGELPFSEIPSGPIEQAAQAALAAKQQPVPRPSELNPAVDRSLNQIVQKALSASPDERYPTARDFYAALQAYCYASSRRRPSSQRRVVLALSVGVIMLTVFFSGSHGTAPDPVQTIARRRSANAPAQAASPVAERLPPALAEEKELTTGWKHLLAGDADSALGIFEEAQQSADDPRLEASVGYAMMMQGRFVEASRAFRNVMRRDQFRNDVGILCSLAYCCAHTQDQLIAAIRALDSVLDHIPDHQPALFLHAILEIHADEQRTSRLRDKSEGTESELTLDLPSPLAEAVAAYRSSKDFNIIDEQLALAAETADGQDLTDVPHSPLRALLPEFLKPYLKQQLLVQQPSK